MKGRISLRLSLVVAGACVAMMAFAASSALATIVKPPNTKVTANLQSSTYAKFLPNNAYGNIYILCSSAGFHFTTPTEEEGSRLNVNRQGTGTFSLGSGSVSMAIEEKPAFEKCSVREGNPEKPEEIGTELVPATITASTEWMLAGTRPNKEGESLAAVMVPASGVVIQAGECAITSASTPYAVTGGFANGTHRLRLDGQLPFSVNNEEACLGLGAQSPFQLEAEYSTTAGGAKKELEILL